MKKEVKEKMREALRWFDFERVYKFLSNPIWEGWKPESPAELKEQAKKQMKEAYKRMRRLDTDYFFVSTGGIHVECYRHEETGDVEFRIKLVPVEYDTGG